MSFTLLACGDQMVPTQTMAGAVSGVQQARESHVVAAAATCAGYNTSIVNGSFESPAIPRNRVTTFYAEETGWFEDLGVEIWNSFNGVRAPDGKQFAEVSADGQGSIWQDLCVPDGTPLTFTFKLRGRNPNESLEVQLQSVDGSGLAPAQVFDAIQGTWISYTFNSGLVSSATPVRLVFRTATYATIGEGSLLDAVT